MNPLRKSLLVAAFALLGFVASHGRAQAACGTLPYTFVNGPPGVGSTVDANTTNANNNFLLGCATTVDNTQIGPNGIYASQIICSTVAQCTFGGTQTYTFPASLIVTGTVTAQFTSSSAQGPLLPAYASGGSLGHPHWVLIYFTLGSYSASGWTNAVNTITIPTADAFSGQGYYSCSYTFASSSAQDLLFETDSVSGTQFKVNVYNSIASGGSGQGVTATCSGG